MTEERKPLAVLFADVADSSRLYRERGDAEASRLIRGLLDRLQQVVERCGGRVIDRIGDELMCAFPAVEGAAQAAIVLQHTTQEAREESPETRALALRIGFHFGAVLENQGRLFGDPVYLAKRLTDSAKAEQIVVSAATRSALAGLESSFRFLEEAILKGQSEPVRLYELLWNALEATLPLAPGAEPSAGAAARLHLHGSFATRTLDPGQSLTVGRAAPSELVLPSSVVSRLHARIESRKGRFVLADVSTNGTFVLGSSAPMPQFVHRDELVLAGRGLIGFGKTPDPESAHTLQYQCASLEDDA